MDLANQKCVPCESGAPILKGDELKSLMSQIEGWELYDAESKIKKDYEFENFAKAIEFINKVGQIAEEQGHHPNLYLHDYKKVRVELWTHKINGLHKNDFILAAKVDNIDHAK